MKFKNETLSGRNHRNGWGSLSRVTMKFSSIFWLCETSKRSLWLLKAFRSLDWLDDCSLSFLKPLFDLRKDPLLSRGVMVSSRLPCCFPFHVFDLSNSLLSISMLSRLPPCFESAWWSHGCPCTLGIYSDCYCEKTSPETIRVWELLNRTNLRKG